MKLSRLYSIGAIFVAGCTAISQPITDSDYLRQNYCYPTPVEEYLGVVHERIERALAKTGIRKKHQSVPNVDGELRIDQYGNVIAFKVIESAGHEKNNEYLEAVKSAIQSSQPYPVIWDGWSFKGTLPIKIHPNSLFPPGCW